MKLGLFKVEQKFRTGEYTHITVTVDAVAEAGDDGKKIVKDLTAITEAVCAEQSAGESIAKVGASSVKSDAGAASTKAPEKKAEQVKVEKESAKAGASAKETPKDAKTEKAPAKGKGKPSPYDKTIDLHKKKVNEFMDEAFPEKIADGKNKGKLAWKIDPQIQHARDTATDMEGKPCLDGEGNVIQEFKDAFIALYKEKVEAAEGGGAEEEGV